MTCQIMLFIMYTGEVRMRAKYIKSNQNRFVALLWTSVNHIQRQKPLDTYFKEEAN